MNKELSERSRSPVFRLAEWAEFVEFSEGRRSVKWKRDEAVKNICQNETIEALTSVFFVAEGMQTKEIGGREYPETVIGEAVVFLDGGEALAWANEELDGDFELVELSIKNQT